MPPAPNMSMTPVPTMSMPPMVMPSMSMVLPGTTSGWDQQFGKFLLGHWLDTAGNSVLVSQSATDERELTAVVSLLQENPEARDRVLSIRQTMSGEWRCGKASLRWSDEQSQRLVWMIDETGGRCEWSRIADRTLSEFLQYSATFPWLLNNADPEFWLPLEAPRDILFDASRVCALLDVRQMIGSNNEPQECLTKILIDYDLHPMRGDYLIPGPDSPLWNRLDVSENTRRAIIARISRVPAEALAHRLQWHGDNELWVGHHRISIRSRDVETLGSRWVLDPQDERKPLEIARLLALYSVLDNPLSNRRNGVHLGLDPELRKRCDYELFASPLNASVPNGRFASKWPHVEWRFGSMGSYPSVIPSLPVKSVLCVNPPFTDAYLSDVMGRLEELKMTFRLRIAMPIQDTAWRKNLQTQLPSASLLKTYYDASDNQRTDLLHPTLLWEDPRCPTLQKFDQDGQRLAPSDGCYQMSTAFPQQMTAGNMGMMLMPVDGQMTMDGFRGNGCYGVYRGGLVGGA